MNVLEDWFRDGVEWLDGWIFTSLHPEGGFSSKKLTKANHLWVTLGMTLVQELDEVQ